MIWISEFFFCVGTMSLVGSIAYIIFLIFRKMMAKSKCGLILNAIKTIIALYLIPVVYIVLRVSKMVFRGGTWMNIGHFGIGTSPTFIKIFNVVALVWFVGLVICVLVRFVEYMSLRKALILNIPVFEERWEELVNEECEKYHLKAVPVFQNECFSTPIVTRAFRPIIVIPLLKFSDKEMRMMVEHEVHHIQCHDLVWTRLALWASWLHWFNPLTYWLISNLELEQEIECDMFVCEHSTTYTAKEYFEFMLSLGETNKKFFFSATLFESKKDVIRRVEAMKERRNRGRASKWMLLVCSLTLALVSSVPVYAMADGMVNAEEYVLAESENLGGNAAESALVEVTITDWSGVNEVVMDIETYSSVVTVDFTAAANTRYFLKSQKMEVGDEVGITMKCTDSDALYWVGVKEMYTNSGRYVYGTGTIAYVFTITEAGTYRVFIENRTDEAIDITGAAVYP